MEETASGIFISPYTTSHGFLFVKMHESITEG